MAGLLAHHLFPGTFPFAWGEQWYSSGNYLAYSSGNCSGFSPDSLLMKEFGKLNSLSLPLINGKGINYLRSPINKPQIILTCFLKTNSLNWLLIK